MVRSYIILLFILTFGTAQHALADKKMTTERENLLKKFHLDQELTPEIMDQFVNNPPDYEEFDMLTFSFNQRVTALDKIACYAAEKHPWKAFKIFNVRYMSSRDNFIPMCNELSITNFVPAMNILAKKYIKVSGYLNHGGTMVYGYYARLNASYILAATAPIYGENYRKEFLDNGYLKFDSNFLAFWRSQGAWEMEMYKEIQAQKSIAKKELTEYYQNKFNLTLEQAQQSSDYHIAFIENTIFDSFSRILNIFQKNERFVLSSELLKQILQNQDQLKYLSEEDLSLYLLHSIVEQLPATDVDLLLSAIPERINEEFVFLEPFHQSAPYNSEALEKMIKKFPELLNAQNDFGKTALMYAVQYSNLAAAKLLFASGAKIDMPTFNKDDFYSYEYDLKAYERTPLMYAAWHGDISIIKYIASIADKSLKDSNGNIAQDYLKMNKNLSQDQKKIAYKILTVR